MTALWIDASAGIAGDMLLGALLDAGADLGAVQSAVDAVVAGSVLLRQEEVLRAGQRAVKAHVELTGTDAPHRTWAVISTLLTQADLPAGVRDRALAVFDRLARAEGRVHGIPAADVHFHEVGALDSIADVVGVCAAIDHLQLDVITAGPVAVGSGTVTAAHGTMPVPVPAVAELARGWRVTAGGHGELTTPTGMALVVALAQRCEDLPDMLLDRVGIGAGSRDVPGRANVTRVMIGTPADEKVSSALVLECNVDDMDPRLWPDVLAQLMSAGADDAWLTPILMKKGRPAHTLSVLCAVSIADRLRQLVLALTSTIGVRYYGVGKVALQRLWVDVDIDGTPVAVKVAHRDGVISQVTAEFDAVAGAATALHRSQQSVLAAAQAAAAADGWIAGRSLPASSAVRSVSRG